MDSWGENLHYTKDEKGVYKCPACGEEAYYDSDYGQQLFIFCPWCGHDTRTEAKNDKKELRYLIQRIKENKYLTRDETNYIIKALGQEPTTKNDLAVDCIDRQATLDAIIKRLGIKNETYLLEAERDIYQQILAMPSVTPQPKTGHWIADIDKWGDVVTTVNGYRCDKCNVFNTDKDNYCPNCGAKMVEPQESEE